MDKEYKFSFKLDPQFEDDTVFYTQEIEDGYLVFWWDDELYQEANIPKLDVHNNIAQGNWIVEE